MPSPKRDVSGSIEQYLRPKRQRRLPPSLPPAALRSSNFACQLLGSQLGCSLPPSLQTWTAVQRSQQFVELPIQLPSSIGLPVAACVSQPLEVCCIELQQQQHSCQNSHNSAGVLAAVAYKAGHIQVFTQAALQDTARHAMQDLQPIEQTTDGPQHTLSDWAQREAAATKPLYTAISQNCAISCCWVHDQGTPQLVAAGARGITLLQVIEGKRGHQCQQHHLQLKSGGQVAKATQVKAMDIAAAYQVVAARQDGLLLWDCRAGFYAVGELPAANSPQLLQPLPGGDLLLAAAPCGLLSLYDVRRLSSNSRNSIISFGGSRASQQLVASYNLPARADEAIVAASAADNGVAGTWSEAATALGCSSSNSSLTNAPKLYPFLTDLQLNPADCNVVAYVRADLQVGLFDLYNNKVLQQVPVRESFGAVADGSKLVGCQQHAPAKACWDATGRVLYTHGLLRQCDAGSGIAHLQSTIAAVDFGSIRGQQQRQQQFAEASRNLSGQASHQNGSQTVLNSGVVTASALLQRANVIENYTLAVGGAGQGGITCRHGQVLHLFVPAHLTPAALAAPGGQGDLLVGTSKGRLMWLGC